MKVYLMRGCSGSGKSYWIETNFTAAQCIVCSADNYHIEHGIYNYQPSNQKKAHDGCYKSFLDVILHPCDNKYLIVDNTNTTVIELAPYVRLCEVFAVPYEIVRIECDWKVAAARNLHKVPADRVFKQWQNLMSESLPPWWKETIVL